MKLTAITPTGDRPETLAYVRECIHHHARGPDQWIIVDDGVQPTDVPEGLTYVRRHPGPMCEQNRRASLMLNLLSAVPRVTGDAIVILEDDNYYHHEYLEVVREALKVADITGPQVSRYYNLKHKLAFSYEHPNCATLGETAFRASFLPEFVDACVWSLDYHQKDADVMLWSRLASGRKVHRYANPIKEVYSLGLKGLKGRGGLGQGHSDHGLQWEQDTASGKILSEWIGRKRAEQLLYQKDLVAPDEGDE